MKNGIKVAIIAVAILPILALIPFMMREYSHWEYYHALEREGKLRSELAVLRAPKSFVPTEKGRCELKVTNLGTTTWTAAEGFRLGGFERDWKLNRVEPARVGNPGRLEVTKEIKQGETWKVSFDIEAPEKAGEYKLHLQMLREKDITPGVAAPDNTWFGDEAVIVVHIH